MDEMRESTKISLQVLDQMEERGLLEDENFTAKVRGTIRPPAGEIYVRTETPRGDLGYYIQSDGSEHPARVKVRSPCFTALSAMQEISRGLLIADVVAIIGSIDIVMGEVDR